MRYIPSDCRTYFPDMCSWIGAPRNPGIGTTCGNMEIEAKTTWFSVAIIGIYMSGFLLVPCDEP